MLRSRKLLSQVGLKSQTIGPEPQSLIQSKPNQKQKGVFSVSILGSDLENKIEVSFFQKLKKTFSHSGYGWF